jgi:hypothetical protein
MLVGSSRIGLCFLTTGILLVHGGAARAHDHAHPIVRSAQSGAWSSPETWQDGKLPGRGDVVQIRAGHAVTYDVVGDQPLRAVHVAGTLQFATDRDTRLDVGLLRIQPGEDCTEEGFDCTVHLDAPPPEGERPALLVGTQAEPIAAGHQALIRLVYFEGMNKESLPAIVCCGGRMDFHGAPLSHSWAKLGANVRAGDGRVSLLKPVSGWRVGDQVIVTTTAMVRMFPANAEWGDVRGPGKRRTPTAREYSQTEQRTITAIEGTRLTLDRPLEFDHRGEGEYRGEVANLSRNVVVESADPDGERGHTMYHLHSSGSIGYAEFRHLGKRDVLGRYSLHFHLAGDSMRGSSVVGASIHHSHNRWLTVHGTNYLVVRDCVGYDSVGHGFFLEDATEVFNVFDGNLAVQACRGKPLPKQVLPFDNNEGAGFWWGNSLNTFTRNVAVECDQYGFRFEMVKDETFDPILPVQQPDGSLKKVDVRTLPFIRFEDNEVHSQRRFGLNLGGIRGVSVFEQLAWKPGTSDEALVKGGHVGGVGPDLMHPFVIRNFRLWMTHWSFHGGTPSVLIDGLDVYSSNYGIWRSRIDAHEYRNLTMREVHSRAFYHPWGGEESVTVSYDENLEPTDDLPPATVITGVFPHPATGGLRVVGTTSDSGPVKEVLVNGFAATLTTPNYATWEAVVALTASGGRAIRAWGQDQAGNLEPRPHVVQMSDEVTGGE